MTKREFLDQLSDALMGEVSQQEYQESMRYYDNYIAESVRGGRPEEEVIKALGNPRLIAKSIVEASTGGSGDVYEQETYQSYDSDDSNKGFHAEFDGDKVNIKYKNFRFNSWYGKLLGILAGIILVVVILGLVGVIATFAFNIILPILLIVWLISAVARMFTRK